MVVCICKAIKCSEIRSIIQSCQNKNELSEQTIGQRCGAGQDCGACVGKIQDLIRSHESVETDNSEVPLVKSV